MYIEKKHWDVSDKAGLLGDNSPQSKNEYKSGNVFYGFFLAPKLTVCLSINELGFTEEHKIFKGFIDSKRPLDRS